MKHRFESMSRYGVAIAIVIDEGVRLMFEWRRKRCPLWGSVLFRGAVPPQAEEFSRIQLDGIKMVPGDADPDQSWVLEAQHPGWGKAQFISLKDTQPLHHTLITHSSLQEDKKELVFQAQSRVFVRVDPPGENILRDRKSFLYFVKVMMGQDGLCALDHVSQRFWTREDLDDEFCHNSDLDIGGLFSLQSILSEEDGKIHWMHSHGLQETGFFDFDIIDPSPDLNDYWNFDIIRAIAFAIVEGNAKPDTRRYKLAYPSGDIRFVEAAHFTDKRIISLIGRDESHIRNRAVLCEPSGWLPGKPRPSRFLSLERMPDDLSINFSIDASLLMAERAKGTYGLFRSLAAELREFESLLLVKLRLPTDPGAYCDKEHLWFQPGELRDGDIEGTLENTPSHIHRLKKGDRGRYPLEFLSDWCISTPLGLVTPRNMRVVRELRSRREEILEELRKTGETAHLPPDS